MRIPVLPILLAALPFVTLETRADEKPEDRLGQIVAPYVGEQTILVAHSDLMAFDVPETIESLARHFAWPNDIRDWIKGQAAPVDVVTQSLPGGSTVDMFVVVDLLDIARVPFFLLLPLDKTTPAAAIAMETRRDIERQFDRKVATEQVGEALVTGSPETIERLRKSTPVARPELARALEACGESAVQFAIIPPAEFRRLMEGIVPRLPSALGGGPTKTFTQGIVWAAVGIDLPPNDPAVHVVIQSADADAAAELEVEIGKLFEAIAQLDLIRDSTERFDELSRLLVPHADGDRLKLDLTEENGGVAALTTVLGPLARALAASLPQRPQPAGR